MNRGNLTPWKIHLSRGAGNLVSSLRRQVFRGRFHRIGDEVPSVARSSRRGTFAIQIGEVVDR